MPLSPFARFSQHGLAALLFAGFLGLSTVQAQEPGDPPPLRVRPIEAPAVPPPPPNPPPASGEGREGVDGSQSGDAPGGAGPDFDGAAPTRQKLFGDFFGLRDELGYSGITFDVDLTQFYQGITSGGREQLFRYGGKLDYLLTVDTETLGLWQGGFWAIRGETRFGESVNWPTGSLVPVNTAMLFPTPFEDLTAVTGLQYTQMLNDSFGVFLGKINTLDRDANAFASGRGLTQFMNGGLVFNPVLARTMPYSAWGAGLVVRVDREPIFTFTVLDALSTPTRGGLNTLFENGIVLNSELRLPTTFFGAPGHQLVGGAWSNRRYTPLDPASYLLLPPSPVPLNRECGSWSLYYNFDQYLWLDPCDDRRGWGVFGRAGLSDAGPNLVHWFLSAGIGGNSTVVGRECDTFGIGYFYMNLSGAHLPLALVPGHEERGIEAYYNAAIAPWFHLTPDLQWVRPASGSDAIVLGLRAKIDF